MHPEFGLKNSINDKLIAALRVAPQLKPSDAKLFMLEAYETAFGIYNHDVNDPERPLASVAMHRSENTTEGSLLLERISVFAEKHVYKYFGLSLIEFLELPRDMCEEVLKISSKFTALENKATNQLNAEINNISGPAK